MEKNFANYLLKFSEESRIKCIILTSFRYVITTFLFSLLYSIIYKENSDVFSIWVFFALMKTSMAIIVGIIYGFLNFTLHYNIKNKIYVLNNIRKKYIYIKGFLGWGTILYISSLPITFRFSELIINALIYSLCGILFGYCMFNFSRNILSKYALR